MRQPTYYMLVALAPGERMHGYGIAKAAEQISDGQVKITAGTLYAALDRLVTAGTIRHDGEGEVNGRTRRYYRITEQGLGDLNAEVQRMQSAIEAAKKASDLNAAFGLAGA